MDIVIGAGMGGLTAAIRLARAGRQVTLLEGRDRVGGLASGVDLGDRTVDGGPYILLDRPGLEWIFEQLGADLGGLLELIPLHEVYSVHRPDGPTVTLYRDLDRTAAGLEETWPGSGARYRRFVERTARIYERLQPLQRQARPGPMALLRRGLVREGAFLLRGLAHHLRAAELPEPVVDALGIWTHIAAQRLEDAPAPLALVPAIVHTHGAWTVKGGIRRIPEVLSDLARACGVRIRLGARVTRIVRDGRRVLGVEVDGERLTADRVFSNAPGVGTYLNLLDPPDEKLNERLAALPLQSPGVAAYMDAEVEGDVPFLQFYLPPGETCRVLVHPGAVDPTRAGHVRLVSPTDHAWAERVGEAGQREHLERVLAEAWWRRGIRKHTVRETRIPVEWGRRFMLYRDSMNPVMTAKFMRRGRLPHQSPVADNLYLVGSATHPGQWVSFAGISGILAADQAA